MASNGHRTHVYVGLAGEGENIAEGGMLRCAEGDDEWVSITNGLPDDPQVRALLVHPDDPAVIYAGTQHGVYRSGDRGDHWEALQSPGDGMDVWSLAFHPNDPNVIYAGYEPCSISRTENGGESWSEYEHRAREVSQCDDLHAAAGEACHRNRRRSVRTV